MVPPKTKLRASDCLSRAPLLSLRGVTKRSLCWLTITSIWMFIKGKSTPCWEKTGREEHLVKILYVFTGQILA